MNNAINVMIDTMQPADWNAVAQIFRAGIATGNATFETTVPTWEEWDAAHLNACRLVARAGNQMFGWAALSPVSGRCVYAGVAEVSIYIAAAARGRGIGKTLLNALIVNSEQAEIWTLQAGILCENVASIALHKACGFREVGFREKLGQLNRQWRNVVLMERRSKVIGQ